MHVLENMLSVRVMVPCGPTSPGSPGGPLTPGSPTEPASPYLIKR